MEKKNFKALLGKILELQNLEEELSAVIRDVEENIAFQSLGIFLKPRFHKEYRLKISRNVSFAYQKNGIFHDDSFLLTELGKFQELKFNKPNEFKFESDYYELLVLPLYYHKELFGFFFIQKEKTHFTDDERYLLETITSLISLLIKLSNQEELIQHLDQTDMLTGLLNYNGFLEKGENLFRQSQRYNFPLALIGIGIRNYSEVLKEIGHEVMNKELIQIAKIISANIRNTEVVGYVHDGLFVVMLNQIQDEGIKTLVNRLQNNVKSKIKSIRTIWGVANYHPGMEKLEDLLHIVEECVYESGRSEECVVIWNNEL